MALKVGDLYGELGLDTGPFDKALSQSGSSLQTFGNQMSSAGKTMTMGITAPILGLGAGAVAASIDFESAFAGVRKTVDATEGEYAQLESGIRQMAKEIPASASAISAVAEAAGQLGIEKANILDFSRTMVDLGEATNLSSTEAASSLARLANITKMPQDQFDNLGSTVVALGNNLATTEAEIVEMALRISGAGSQIGLTEAQILGFSGALSSVGISAEAGGTAISKVMIETASRVGEGGLKLKEFADIAGMSSEDFKKAFEEDAAGAIITFVEGLGKVSAEGGNVFGLLEDLGLSEVRVRDALLRASGAGDLFRESLELGSAAWEENTALTDEAAQRYATTASQLAIFKNEVVDMAITLGQVLIPILMDAARSLRPLFDFVVQLVEWFSKLPQPVQTAAVAFAGLLAAIGPMLVIAGTLTTSITTLIPVVGLLSKALLALSANPIVLVIAGLVALGAAIYLIYKNWDTITEAVGRFADYLTGKAAPVIDWFSTKATEVFSAIRDKITEVFDGITSYISGVWDGITSYLTGVWNGIASFFSDIWGSKIGTELQATLAQWGQWISAAWDAISGVVSAALENVADVIGAGWEAISSATSTAWNAITGVLSTVWSALSGAARTAFDAISSVVRTVWDAISSVTRTVWNTLASWIGGKLAEVRATFESVWNAIKTVTEVLWSGIKAIVLLYWEALQSVVVVGLRVLRGDFEGARDEILRVWDALWSTVKSVLSGAWDAIKSTVVTKSGELITEVKKIPGQILTALGNLKSDMIQVGKDIIQGMIDGIGSMGGALKDAVTGKVNDAVNAVTGFLGISSPSKVFEEIGIHTMEGFGNGLKQGYDTYVAPFIKHLGSALMGVISSNKAAAQQVFGGGGIGFNVNAAFNGKSIGIGGIAESLDHAIQQVVKSAEKAGAGSSDIAKMIDQLAQQSGQPVNLSVMIGDRQLSDIIGVEIDGHLNRGAYLHGVR